MTKFVGNVETNELVHIQNNCVKLKKLVLTNIQHLVYLDPAGVIELLKALNGLQVFHIECNNGTSSDSIRRLMEACSENVSIECDFCDTLGDQFHDCIRLIGARLRVLWLSQLDFDDIPSDLLSVFGGIEELLLNSTNFTDVNKIESIFAEPLPNLRKLLMGYFHDSSLLSVIARSASNLIHFSCSFKHVNGDDFARLFHANKYLWAIDVQFEVKSEESEIRTILDLISTFKICQNMRHADVKSRLVDENDHYIATSCMLVAKK